MNIKNSLASVGAAALVLNSAAPAAAQTVPGSEHSAHQPMSYQAPPMAISGPRFVLRQNDRDELGRPRPMKIEDALREYGPATTQMLIRDDQMLCGTITRATEADARVRAAEEELRQAEIQLSMAENDQQRRVAERRRSRARLNLIDVLLGVVGVGAGILTGGLSTVAGIGYAGMVAANQGQSQVRRVQSDKDAKLWYDQLQLYGERLKLFDGRLELYDLRMQIYTFRGSVWDNTMKKYCDMHVRPFDPNARALHPTQVSVGYQGGPAEIIPQNFTPRWQQQ